MPGKIFLSYHHRLDAFRAGQIRDCGLIEPGGLTSEHVWAAITHAGDFAIRRWIDEQMNEADCVIVLVGQITAGRKWIDYEIRKAWQDGRGLLGIHVHNLKNHYGSQTSKGANPFADVAIDGVSGALAGSVRCYDPPYLTSSEVNDYICTGLPLWIERAIASRRASQPWPSIRSA
jgi:hypothetical protein